MVLRSRTQVTSYLSLSVAEVIGVTHNAQLRRVLLSWVFDCTREGFLLLLFIGWLVMVESHCAWNSLYKPG